MSFANKEWVVVFLFFLGFFVFTAAETLWLCRSKAVVPGRAFAVSFGSNIFSITAGFFVSMVIFGMILAMARDGSLENVGVGDATIWVAVSVAALGPIGLLILAKCLLLRFLGITTVENKIGYSVAASLLFFISVAALPAVSRISSHSLPYGCHRRYRRTY